MRALLITGPHEAAVAEVPPPQAGPGQVVVRVSRAGVCGTDVEFFTGTKRYLQTGLASYPMRIGHEWSGTVVDVGAGVDVAWLNRRVTGDTMIGCGRCRRCLSGRHHVCDERLELGVRGGMPGALGELMAFPAASLHELPETVDDAAGAMVEPGGNAWRAVEAARLAPGERVLVAGPGTIGLLCAMFARAAGAQAHLLGVEPASIAFARGLGFPVWTAEELPEGPWHAVIDAATSPSLPARAVELVEPGRRVVYIGLAGEASMADTRELVFKDVTAVGILGASAGLAPAIAAYDTGAVDPRPLIAAAVPLSAMPAILAGRRPERTGPGPKFHAAF